MSLYLKLKKNSINTKYIILIIEFGDNSLKENAPVFVNKKLPLKNEITKTNQAKVFNLCNMIYLIIQIIICFLKSSSVYYL